MIKHAMPRCLTAALVALSAALLVANASADGPVILGGDDLTAHGGRNADGTLFGGWLYIRKALENLAPTAVDLAVNNGSVAVLGSMDSTAMDEDAGAAYHFAVPRAAMTTPLSGVVTFHEGAAAINTFFAGVGSPRLELSMISRVTEP